MLNRFKDPLQIIVFKSYGTTNYFHCRGRALEDETIDLSKRSWWQLFINSYKRFETDEVKYSKLSISLSNTHKIDVTTDEHGYFVVNKSIEGLDALIDDQGWLHFKVSYNDTSIKRQIQLENKFSGEMLIPSKESSFGIVSDIDDTILKTGLVSSFKWQVLYNTFFKNPLNRDVIEGTSRFYNLLHKGKSGREANPVFYVSHSPWNLYRYLEMFLKSNNFPKGPILLRSFKVILQKRQKNEKVQKHKEIIRLLKTYPNLKFILIGDCGEKDPDIYLKISTTHPKQILAIYLRSVKRKNRMRRVRDLIENKTIKTPIIIVDNSEDAIGHAREFSFLK